MNKEALIAQLEQYGIGLERGTVALADYSPAWASAYELVERWIRHAIRGCDGFAHWQHCDTGLSREAVTGCFGGL